MRYGERRTPLARICRHNRGQGMLVLEAGMGSEEVEAGRVGG